MATQEQTFNLNSFGFEGAGKVYETLAQNAAGKAVAAGQEKTQALAEHRQAASTATQFRNAASSTKSRANNVMNTAVSKLDAANRAKVVSDTRTSLTISTALARVGEQYLAAEVDAKTLEGQLVGVKRKAELDDMIRTDTNAVVKALEATLYDLQTDPDYAFLKSYAKLIVG